ncbi:hypothetical protein GTW51_21950 [Aurantimonas aggregata]|uniref:Uncharacterized protein n=1 Tax=Aurantimonas aggregata TaxID=2047720 RepID=A0A6L9MP76_9HYPH|nr:hypothetical protein [Aurantimonas aggregata]NDV89330.1 hypothetical protein [Aurantimonas aggregata]
MQHLRQILAVLLLLASGLGTPGYAMPSGDMSRQVIESSADQRPLEMPVAVGAMPDDCGSCADEAAMAACISACLAVQAVLGNAGAKDVSVRGAFRRLPTQQIHGSVTRPEPFPPRIRG